MKVVFHAGNGVQELTITIADTTVTLKGYLVDDMATKLCVNEALRYLGPSTCRFLIVADECKVGPHGEDVWTDRVAAHLRNCELLYDDSSLSMIIQCDANYRHPATSHKVAV